MLWDLCGCSQSRRLAQASKIPSLCCDPRHCPGFLEALELTAGVSCGGATRGVCGRRGQQLEGTSPRVSLVTLGCFLPHAISFLLLLALSSCRRGVLFQIQSWKAEGQPVQVDDDQRRTRGRTKVRRASLLSSPGPVGTPLKPAGCVQPSTGPGLSQPGKPGNKATPIGEMRHCGPTDMYLGLVELRPNVPACPSWCSSPGPVSTSLVPVCCGAARQLLPLPLPQAGLRAEDVGIV